MFSQPSWRSHAATGYCSTPHAGMFIASPMPVTNIDKQDNPSFRQQWPGMLIFFVVLLGGMLISFALQQPVMEWLSLTDGRPGQEPPWYFINRDFAEGICAAGALVLSLTVGVVVWRWWPIYAAMIIWMSLIWLGGHVAKAFIIFQHCPGLLDGQRNTTRWPDFESYINDPLIDGWQIGVILGSFLLSFVMARAGRKRQAAQVASS